MGIVVTLVSLIDSFVGAERKLSNKRGSIPLWKKVWMASFRSIAKCYESGKICNRFRYPTNDVDYIKRQNDFSIFLRVYAKTRHSKRQS